MHWALQLAQNVLLAGLIAIAAFWFSGWVKSQIQKWSRRHPQIDDTLFDFLGTIARYAIIVFAVVFILGRFGVQTTSIVAVIGAAGLAIGLALQGTLSNIAAGVMLVAFRPFKLGDFITAAGHSGTVKEINLFTTELATTDNVQVIIPNGKVWNDAIINFSHHTTRRVDLIFGVSYGANLKTAEAVIRKVVEADERVHADPAVFVKVTNLGDSSVDLTMRAWCNASDYFVLKCDLTEEVKIALDGAKIDIPFPTRTLLQS